MTQRYRDRGDGAIQDLHTSLYWLRQPLRPVTTESKQRRFWWLAGRWLRRLIGRDVADPATTRQAGYTWEEALQAAEAFNQAGGCGGYQDWRLPNRGELKTLRDRPHHPAAFPVAIKGWYWTSWPHRNPRYAWFVDFDTGQTGYLSQ